MNSMITGAVALLATGFGWQWLRQRVPAVARPASAERHGHGRLLFACAATVIGFPVAVFLLAGLVQSDKLAWLAVLSGGAALALLACAAVFCIGMALCPRNARTEARAAAAEAELPKVEIVLDRDSVHASDGSVPKRIRVSSGATVRALLEQAQAAIELPSISGGKATWVVERVDARGASMPIAVCAQQWREPAFLVAAHTRVLDHFGPSVPARLRFAYQCQVEPGEVFRDRFERIDGR